VSLYLGNFSSAFGEYRAFMLKITKRTPAAVATTATTEPTKSPETTATPPTEQDFRLVKSNLDPEQYPTYYQVRADENIQYIQTWMCRGRTNLDADICDPPVQPSESLDSKK
jgi:hypothetical protein